VSRRVEVEFARRDLLLLVLVLLALLVLVIDTVAQASPLKFVVITILGVTVLLLSVHVIRASEVT
jgi:F0F1-type ATP synthase assembly protein I